MPRISRDTDIYPISLRELEVLRVEDLTPAMRRITFGGSGLLAHTRDGEPVPALVSDGFDDDVRLILPDPTTGERPYPHSLGDGRLDWNEQVNDLFRTYTVRSWTPDAGESGELAIDFARHGAGLAENWSATAGAGDRVFIAGPKNCGSHPSHTDWLLLVGDETALPAVGRCLEECPADHPVVAFVEVPTRADIQDIDCAADLDMHWVVRDEGGDFTEELLTHVRGGGKVPEGTPFVWAAGEAGRLRTVRALAKKTGVPREHVQITGYWRRNNAVAEGAAAGTAGTSSLSPLMELYEMAEIAPGLALRSAAELRVFEVVDAASATPGATPTVADIAPAVGVGAGVLLRFLRYLESLKLVTLTAPEPDELSGGDAAALTGVALTPLGQELSDPDGPVTRLTGPEALRPLAWLHLAEGLRSGAPVTVGSTGSTWAQLRSTDPSIVENLADAEATRAQWVAPALAQGFGPLAAKLTGGAGLTSVAIAGAGEGTSAAVYADELLRHHDDLSVVILDTGAGTDRLTAEVGESRRDRVTVVAWDRTTTPEVTAGAVIVVDPCALAAPEDVPALLESAAGIAPRVVVVTRLLAETGDEDHDYEEDLTRLLLDGRAVPTRRDLARAVSAAGLTGVADLPVGWGTHAVVTLRI
ncbi:siderophore-interacting protein [uncultured Corynebacterium sp.]|uniref:siderophore-interacting protein n=1 Tax=uncultured Corynebacterium sp. TaxID=159447 RepID=UPI0025FD10F7|nr:siderophore-interacting protein [uncultured Corynebacterium sp.]